MTADDQAQRRQRVADYVKRYREENPKYTHAYIKANGGPSGPTVTGIEEARSVKTFSLAALEKALDLPENTLVKILNGEAVPPPRRAKAPRDLSDYSDDELLAELQRRLAVPPRRRGNPRHRRQQPRPHRNPVYAQRPKSDESSDPEWYVVNPFGTGS
jgi:hypothetical protein